MLDRRAIYRYNHGRPTWYSAANETITSPPERVVSTFGQAAERNVCKTWNHTNSSKPAHSFVTCRRTKQRTSLRVYNQSALHAGSVSLKSAYGIVNSPFLPLVF